ncbi:MAG: alpha/beta hydrolase [Actinocatenispora sp.]
MVKRFPAAVLAAATVGAALCVPTAAAAHTPRTPPLAWHDCHTADTPPSLECATLTVPLDWSDPDGPTIELAVNRLPARDPAHRIGPLLVNPGGPGGSGTEVVAYGGMLLGAPELATVRDRFDLIGFDPRGVGGSTPVTCTDPVYDPAAPTFPSTPDGYAAMVDSSHRHGTDCARSTGPLLGHVDTISAARDVEAVRVGLGAPKISWLGVSYGTELGSFYADLYPDRVRAMVLDGAVDHSRLMAQAAVEESAATEREFHRFADWCDDSTDCALHGTDVLAGLDALTARADRGEIHDATLGRTVSGAEITSGSYSYLTLRDAWPGLSSALAAAEKTPSEPEQLDAGIVGVAPIYPAYRAVSCQDFAPALHGLADLRTRAAAVRAAAPHSWRYSEMWDMTTGCAGWPVPAANPPHAQHVSGVDTVLVVGNRYDPATPYRWAQALAGHIDGSRLLTVDGDGHTGLENNACAREKEAGYLVTGKAPAPDTVCAS